MAARGPVLACGRAGGPAMRHVTRHVERMLYAFEEHYCGRCGMHCSSHGLYIIHPCEGPPEWPVAIPERVRYDGEHEEAVWRRQQQVVAPTFTRDDAWAFLAEAARLDVPDVLTGPIERLPDPLVMTGPARRGWGPSSLLPALHEALRLDMISDELRARIIAGSKGIES
jgi:hypothetical protein